MSLCPAGKYCLGLCHDHNATSWRAILRMPPPYDPLHNATVGVVRPIRWVPALDTLSIEERAGLRVPPSSRALIWNGRTDGNRGRQFVVGYATRALTARAGQPASMPIQFQSAGLNLVLLTPLWTRTAHVVPLRMVRCRFPKLRYG